MDNLFFHLDQTTISFMQLAATIIGGAFALLLFRKSNKEKRRAFILSIFDKLYDDKDINSVLYAADKNKGLKKLKLKVDLGDTSEIKMERETDKTLRFIDFVGELVKEGNLRVRDLHPFKYELLVILNDETIRSYISYEKTVGIHFRNLDWLREKLSKTN